MKTIVDFKPEKKNYIFMTKKLNLLLLSVFITIGLFIYLAIHHYAIKLGIGGNSICSVSETINCDAAATSQYAEVFGIPVALLGGFYHIFLFGLLLFYKFNWVDESIYLKNTLRSMLVVSTAISVVMGLISFFVIKVICPFCFGTYVFSFINLFLGWNLMSVMDRDFSIAPYFSTYKSHLILLAFIPVTSWIVSGMVQENYGLSEINKLVPEKIAQWKNSQTFQFDPQIGLRNEVTSEKIVLVEFADFKCPHCRAASQTIDTFLKGHPNVQFLFKPFPLDGTCNASSEMSKGDGSRCVLAAWALCAEQIAKKGWPVQHWLFEKQEEISAVRDLSTLLPEIEKKFQIKPTELSACADSSATYDTLKKSSAEGEKAKVSGTPTIYLNGKKLGYGHILQVLTAAVAELN